MTYEWTFEVNTENSTMPVTDWSSYIVVDADDGSVSIDVMAFASVAETEQYAFVLSGKNCQLQVYMII